MGSASKLGPASVTAVALILGGSSVAAQSPSAAPADPALDATLAAIELMNRAPVGIRETCRPTDAFLEGMVAAAECEVPDGLVFYSRFRDDAILAAAYEGLRASAELEADTGSSCAEGPFDGPWGDDDGQADGRVLCHLTNGAFVSVWTHDADTVLAGILLSADADYATLASTWEGARLLSAEEAGGPSSSLTPSASASAGPAPAVTADPGASATPSDPAPAPTLEGGAIVQWASSATASTQYGTDAWAASQATGAPDTEAYGDFPTAWAPAGSDIGEQWIELGYDMAVTPVEVVIWESSGAGFVTRVEALDTGSGEWVTLFEGEDTSPDFLVGFSPPLQTTDVVTDRLRITIDTQVPGWNEIDAVGLIGTPTGTP